MSVDPIIALPAGIAIGAALASFFNVCLYRIPRGMSVSNPKQSHCPSCKKTIPPWENIPIVTWIIQGGKCSSCGSKIPAWYFLVEVGGALIGLLLAYLFFVR